MLYLGIDVGGTSIKGGLVTKEGKLLSTFKMPVVKDEIPEETLNKLILLVNKFLKDNNCYKKDIVGVGVGVPGIIDSTNGIVSFSGNLKWIDLPLKKILEKGLNLPVKITNDANAAAIAESKFGSGKNYKSFLMVTLGTGIGSGIYVDGKLYEGNLGKGGEFGHSLLVMDGRKCNCGRKGCLEAYASATALIKDTKKMIELHPESLLSTLSKKSGTVDAKLPFEVSKMGDPFAKELIRNYVKYLSEGLINYFNTFRPEAVILSGGIAEEGDYLISKIKKYCDRKHYGFKLSPRVEIVKSSVGYDSGKIGAAALFMD